MRSAIRDDELQTLRFIIPPMLFTKHAQIFNTPPNVKIMHLNSANHS